MALLISNGYGARLTLAELEKFQVQASTNLQTWQTLTNELTLTNGGVQFEDSTATNYPSRFYRVIEQP